MRNSMKFLHLRYSLVEQNVCLPTQSNSTLCHYYYFIILGLITDVLKMWNSSDIWEQP
jgi:hypothetical protein